MTGVLGVLFISVYVEHSNHKLVAQGVKYLERTGHSVDYVWKTLASKLKSAQGT